MQPCDCCQNLTTPLFEVKNPRGMPIGFFGVCCYLNVRETVDVLSNLYGANFQDGQQISSPRGTPDVRSYENLVAAIGEKLRFKSAVSA